MTATYTCSVCGNTYDKDWSDEEASAEYEQNFGVPLGAENVEIACDDCYKLFMRWAGALELDLHSRDEADLASKIAAKPEEHHALRYHPVAKDAK